MDHILYYPHYLPNKKNLRSYLLLYDRISTIIPLSDQKKILKKRRNSKLIERLPEKTLNFCDPAAYNQSWWSAENTSMRFLNYLVYNALLDEKTRNLANRICENRNKKGWLLENTSDLFQSIRNEKWKYLSSAKLVDGLQEQLVEKGLAVKVRENSQTQDPILIHPRLGDHLMSRLARDVSADLKISPVASTSRDQADLLIDEDLLPQDQRVQLVAMSLDVAVPTGIADLSITEFLDIRDNLAETRKALPEMARAFITNLKIDSETDAKRFHERLSDVRSGIESRIVSAQRRAPWRGISRVAIDIVAAAVGGGTAAAFGDLGDVAEGMLAGSIGAVIGQPGTQLSTRIFPHDEQYVEQMASVRSKVLRNQAAVARHQRQYEIWHQTR